MTGPLVAVESRFHDNHNEQYSINANKSYPSFVAATLSKMHINHVSLSVSVFFYDLSERRCQGWKEWGQWGTKYAGPVMF